MAEQPSKIYHLAYRPARVQTEGQHPLAQVAAGHDAGQPALVDQEMLETPARDMATVASSIRQTFDSSTSLPTYRGICRVTRE